MSGMAALAVMQHQGLRRCRCGAAAAGLILQQPGLLDMMQWCCTGNADSAAQFTPGKIAVVLWAGTKLGVQARHYSEAQVMPLNRVCSVPVCCATSALAWREACGAVPCAQPMQSGRG